MVCLFVCRMVFVMGWFICLLVFWILLIRGSIGEEMGREECMLMIVICLMWLVNFEGWFFVYDVVILSM